MTFQKTALMVAAMVVGALPMIGCGSEKTLAPTAPDSGALTTSTSGARTKSVAPALVTAESTPLVISSLVAGTSCPALQFKIGTYVINTDATTKYEGGTCSNLQAGTSLTTLNVTRPSEAALVLYATQITFQTTATTPPPTTTPASVTTDGVVTSLVSGTACPDLQFMFGSYLFKISSATAYSQASCADVKVGVHVYVAGTKRDSDNFVAVTGLGIKRDTTTPTTPTTPSTSTTPTTPTTPTKPTATPVAGEGVITSLSTSTSCPALQFFIGTYLIKADASTQFNGGKCADLRPGLKVAVTGFVNADGSVSASSISGSASTPPPPSVPEVEGEGVVTGLVSGTSCPSLKVQIGEYAVAVTDATQFVGGSCSTLAVGRKLNVRGTMTGDKTATASRIIFEN